MGSSKKQKTNIHLHIWLSGGLFFSLSFILLSSSVIGQTEEQNSEQDLSSGKASVVSEIIPSNDQQDQVIIAYQQNRQRFEHRKDQISTEVTRELQEINGEITSIQAEIDAGNQHLESNTRLGQPELPREMAEEFQRIHKKTSRYEEVLTILSLINGAAAHILSPLAFVARGEAEKILFIFLPITVLNIFLYLLFKQKASFMRHKKWLIAFLVTVIIASAASLMAAPVDKRQVVESRLRYAEEMLTLTGSQKAIAILESREPERITLPPGLSSGDLNLQIYETVIVDSAEYYVTLAALYTAEGKTGKAIEAVSKIAEKKSWNRNPSEKTILSVITFLVENSHSDIAGTAVTNHAGYINDTKTLLDLADYLKLHTMQVSSDHVMKLVLEKTKHTKGLAVLASYYFASGKTDKAHNLLIRALKASTNIADIILVAEACLTQETEDVFKKIPLTAQKLSGTVKDFIDLAGIFHKKGQSAQVGKTLERAIKKSSDLNQLKQVAQSVIEFNQGPLLDKIREQVISLTPGLANRNPEGENFKEDYARCLQFVDFLASLNRQEDAAKLFEDIVARVKEGRRADEQYISLMLDMSGDGVRRNLKKQAASIALRLMSQFKPRAKAYVTYLKLQENFLQSMGGLPDNDLVSIPLYNGLLNEDINRLSHVEQVYMQAVLESLDMVNKSYGSALPETLNEYYLLGRLWKRESRTNVLASLDRVYTLLESRVLADLKEKEREKILTEPQAALARLMEQREKQLVSIQEHDAKIEEDKVQFARLRQEMIQDAEPKLVEQKEALDQLTVKVLIKLLATIVLQLIVIGLLIGCVILAWKYSQRMREHRAYGFFTRFIELNGWLRISSILGLLSGFVLVLISQFLQMFQKVHEIALQGVPGARYALADAATDRFKKVSNSHFEETETKREERKSEE